MTQLLAELGDALPERYRVDRQIGQGGMATVFVAEDTRYGRKVAVKVLHPDLGSSVGADRFEREIQVLGKLNHPHILSVLDSGASNGLFYYVMPLVEGESLRDRLDRESQLPVDEAIAITCDVADALAHAHSQGIVHRDIKPENVLIHGGHAVVTDFGIARLAHDAATTTKLTMTGTSVGTAAYMSPEQAAGEEVDTRSDIYSLGCMLYELLVGEPPFTGPNSRAIMARHTYEVPRSIRVVRPAVPPEVEEAVLQALEKSPVDRYASMQAFSRALLGQGGTASTWRATRTMATHAHTRSRAAWLRGGRLAGVAGLVLVAGGLATWQVLSRSSSARPAGATGADRVAVTYFTASGDGADLKSLADGLTESLIRDLSSVPNLRVASRDGVAPLRGASPDSVARALQVGTIVAGSVSSRGAGMHVDVQVVDAASNATVGTRGFDVATAAVGTLRDSIANQVVLFLREQVGIQLSSAERRSGTASPQAWLAVQRGERRRKDADSLVLAGDYAGALSALASADTFFAAAASLDLSWPEPLALRSLASTLRMRPLRAKPIEMQAAIDSGLVYANAALRVDERNADALEARGTLQMYRGQVLTQTDPAESNRYLSLAETDLRAATETNPGQASAFVTLSRLYYLKKEIQSANLAAQNAYRADAYLRNAEEILNRLFWTSHDLENFSEAEKWCRIGHDRFPKNPAYTQCSLWLLSTKYKEPYNPEAAWAVYDTLLKVTPPGRLAVDTLLDRIIVAMVLAKAADARQGSPSAKVLADSARRLLIRARPSAQLDPRHELSGYEAVARVFLHDYDEAVRLIEQYVASNPEHIRGYKTNTQWWWRDPGLQNHPRFKALIANVR